MSAFKSKKNLLSLTMLSASFLLFGLAFLRVHFQVQTTLMGYDIARLKADEELLLEERGLLKMRVAKLTSKGHLNLLSESVPSTESGEGKLALSTKY